MVNQPPLFRYITAFKRFTNQRVLSYPLSFQIFAHSFAPARTSTPFFSSVSALFAKNDPGWGYSQRATFKLSNDPLVPLQPNALGATMSEGTRILHDPGKQLRSPRCLRIESGHRGQLVLGPQCKSCLGTTF